LVKKELEKKYKTKVIPCKTIRDRNNVALSSRNFLLNKSNLITAAKIYETLGKIKKNTQNKKNIPSFLNLQKKELKNNFKIKIDYLELRNINNLKISSTKKNSRLFIAYYLNNVRLIDNL
jgi:Panthothenate synthetase